MTTTAPPTPNLNHAAAQLIEAIDNLDDVPAFRERLSKAVLASNLCTHEWPDPLANEAWKAFAALVDAVTERKEHRHG